MKSNLNEKIRLSKKISSAVGSETPLRDLAGNLSQTARYALNEANTLTIENVEIRLERLPKNLEGFRLLHLSDIHHSPFTQSRTYHACG